MLPGDMSDVEEGWGGIKAYRYLSCVEGVSLLGLAGMHPVDRSGVKMEGSF